MSLPRPFVGHIRSLALAYSARNQKAAARCIENKRADLCGYGERSSMGCRRNVRVSLYRQQGSGAYKDTNKLSALIIDRIVRQSFYLGNDAKEESFVQVVGPLIAEDSAMISDVNR